MKNKIVFASVIIVVVISTGLIGIDLYSKTDHYTSKFGKTISVSDGPNGEKIVRMTAPTRKTEGQIIPVEDGWSQYTSTENEFELRFSYPSNWSLTEKNADIFLENGEVLFGGKLETVQVEGDGYLASFTNIGKGFPADNDTIHTEYIISGRKRSALEAKTGMGFVMIIGVACEKEISFSAKSPTSSKEITNKIIASIQCQNE